MYFIFFKETYAKTLNFKTTGFFLQHPLFPFELKNHRNVAHFASTNCTALQINCPQAYTCTLVHGATLAYRVAP